MSPADVRHNPLTIDRIERAMVLVAYMMEIDGPAHMPAYETLEQELLKLKSRDAVRDRARNLIAAHTLDGGRKAIA